MTAKRPPVSVDAQLRIAVRQQLRARGELTKLLDAAKKLRAIGLTVPENLQHKVRDANLTLNKAYENLKLALYAAEKDGAP